MRSSSGQCKHKVVYELVTDKCWICHLPTTSVKWGGVRCQQCCAVWHNICLQKSSEDWDAVSEDDDSSDESFSDSESSGSELELPEPSNKSHTTNEQDEIDDIQDSKNNLMDLDISDDLQSDPESEPESSEQQKTKDGEETDTVDFLDQSKSPTKSSKVLKCHVNYCFVCGKPQTKLARHLERHVNEDAEIAQALQLPKSSKNRKVLLENFRNLGNFRHNSVVKATGSGCLKVKRSSKQSSSFETYDYCLYCKCMLSRKDLSRHMQRCAWRPETNVEEGVFAQSAQSTPSQPISSALCSVLGKMHKDEVSIAAMSDHYLMQFAQSLFNKHGSDGSKHEYIRQKVRELGRLLVTLRHTSSICNMEEAMNPGNFFILTSAVKEVSGFDHENSTFKSPSLALKIGHSLRKISDIIMCRALMEKDQEVIASIRRFHTLYKTKWSEFVSHSAVSNPSEALETGSAKDIQGEALVEIGEGIDDMDSGSQQLPNVSTLQGSEEMLASVTFASADVSETAAQDTHAACVTSGSPHLPDSVTQGVRVSRMGCVKRRWTDEETRAVMKHMRPFIENGITVSIEQCRKCKEKEQHILSTRSVQNIRDFVRNRGVALKRYSNDIQFAGLLQPLPF